MHLIWFKFVRIGSLHVNWWGVHLDCGSDDRFSPLDTGSRIPIGCNVSAWTRWLVFHFSVLMRLKHNICWEKCIVYGVCQCYKVWYCSTRSDINYLLLLTGGLQAVPTTTVAPQTLNHFTKEFMHLTHQAHDGSDALLIKKLRYHYDYIVPFLIYNFWAILSYGIHLQIFWCNFICIFLTAQQFTLENVVPVCMQYQH